MKQLHRGFSLIEIVIALGIISFAIVAILGLFPVATKAARDSRNETHAAMIARLTIDQLKSQPPPMALLPIGSNSPFTNSPFNGNIPRNLTNASPLIAYVGYDINGEPFKQLSASTMTNPTNMPYVGEIIISPNKPTAGVAQVTINITYPGSAPGSNRTTNSFVTLIRNQL